jgi:hypothetical protein
VPQIVSGLDPKVRLEAYLAGERGQRQLETQQQEQAAEQQRLRHAYLQDIQKYRSQQAKALEDVNARAQMGDVLAMQQQELEAKAAGMPPDQKRLQSYAELGQRVTDPDARKQLMADAEDLEKGIQAEEQKKALNQMVQSGIADGVITPEEIQQRQQMGEEPEQLGKEIAERKVKQRSDAVAMEKNTLALKKARALLESLPSEDNPDYDQALEVVVGLEKSPSNMTNPNAGKTVLDLVQRLASKEKSRAFKENLMKEPFMGFGGPEMPQGPTPGTHATVGKVFGSGKSLKKKQAHKTEEQIIEELVKSGTPLTQENLDAALGQ